MTFIRNARAGKPDIAFAMANIPHRSFIGGRDDLITKTEDYNAALLGLLKQLSTNTSPIYLVQFRENYTCKCLESGLYRFSWRTACHRRPDQLCC